MQPESNLCNRTRNSQKPKRGSPQRRLAKPAAKRGPSRADKGKKPLGAKTQQKRPRHAALTPTNAWHSARQACLRDRRESEPRARFRATQTSVVGADARTASLKNAPPRWETALRQRLSEAPRRELHPAHAAGVHRPRAARFPRPACLRPGPMAPAGLHARLGRARCRRVNGVRCTQARLRRRPRGRRRRPHADVGGALRPLRAARRRPPQAGLRPRRRRPVHAR